MPKIGSLRAKKATSLRRIKAEIRKQKTLQRRESKLAAKAGKAETAIRKLENQWSAASKKIDALKERVYQIDTQIANTKKK